MATAVADPPVAPSEQQPPAGGVPGGLSTPAPESGPQPTASCAKCGAPLAGGQDWCLKCGAGGPDSLSSRAPTWRSAAVVLTTLAILVAGAATAAYAALSKHDAKAPASTTVAQVATTPARDDARHAAAARNRRRGDGQNRSADDDRAVDERETAENPAVGADADACNDDSGRAGDAENGPQHADDDEIGREQQHARGRSAS